jgi:hypothetical protein
MIYRADELLLGFAALVAVLVAIELGFRLGLRHQPNADGPTRAHFAALQPRNVQRRRRTRQCGGRAASERPGGR